MAIVIYCLASSFDGFRDNKPGVFALCTGSCPSTRFAPCKPDYAKVSKALRSHLNLATVYNRRATTRLILYGGGVASSTARSPRKSRLTDWAEIEDL